jgi:NAD(P)-dependent dehydrogenase (short-subunit alcohol dehydrogenase family)
VLDRSEEGCGQLREQYGEKIHCIASDVRQFADNDRIVTEFIEKFGQLDYAIGNAGIWDYNVTLVDMPALTYSLPQGRTMFRLPGRY